MTDAEGDGRTTVTPKAAAKIGPDGKPMAEEIGGPTGPEPTRHGEWEVNGRVVDF